MDQWNFGNFVIGGIGVVNLGFIVYSVKLVIAPIAVTVKNLNQSIAQLNSQIDELYDSRNTLNQRVTKIETIHEVKGCNQPHAGKA